LKILIVAAHPDDEVIGMGATIKKLSLKNNIHLCVVTEGASAQYQNERMIEVRKNSCKKSAKTLGISKITFLDYPDMKLDAKPHLEINRSLENVIDKFKPNSVYTTPYNDLNNDHKLVFDSTLIATRPTSSSVKELICYELPGLTKHPFTPNFYYDVSKYFSHKIRAFKIYKSEVEKFPHPRSIKSLENLAIFRGVESGLSMAESFQIIRKISS